MSKAKKPRGPAKDRPIEDMYHTSDAGLPDILQKIEASISDWLEARNLPPEKAKLQGLVVQHHFRDSDVASFAIRAEDALRTVDTIRDTKLNAEARAAVSHGIMLGMAVRELSRMSGEREDSEYVKMLYPFYCERRSAGVERPNVTRAREYLRANHQKFYETKRKEKPNYWRTSFKTIWSRDLVPALSAKYEAGR